MSFAVWQQHPPFKFAPTDKEQIYKVGSVWVVTDVPARATQAEVDAVLNAQARTPTTEEKLNSIGLTVDEIKSAILPKA